MLSHSYQIGWPGLSSETVTRSRMDLMWPLKGHDISPWVQRRAAGSAFRGQPVTFTCETMGLLDETASLTRRLVSCGVHQRYSAKLSKRVKASLRIIIIISLISYDIIQIFKYLNVLFYCFPHILQPLSYTVSVLSFSGAISDIFVSMT